MWERLSAKHKDREKSKKDSVLQSVFCWWSGNQSDQFSFGWRKKGQNDGYQFYLIALFVGTKKKLTWYMQSKSLLTDNYELFQLRGHKVIYKSRLECSTEDSGPLTNLRILSHQIKQNTRGRNQLQDQKRIGGWTTSSNSIGKSKTLLLRSMKIRQ